MKVEFRDLVILVLGLLCFILLGVGFELNRETEAIKLDYEYELYRTREHLNFVKDELGKVKHHIWLLNKEREGE